MTQVVAPTGGETHIRAIVFREGNTYVAQCLEYDIATQAPDINSLLKRLYATVAAEFAAGGEDCACPAIAPAPNYFHGLWDKRSVALQRITVPTPVAGRLDFGVANFQIEAALAA